MLNWFKRKFKKNDEPSVTVLGHKFYPMSKLDWEGLAGAEEGSLICYLSDSVLLWDPKGGILSEIYDDGQDVCGQRDWTFDLVL